MQLRLHKFLPHTEVEGPGARACIWVQGCPIHCQGCAVPWTWDEEGGSLVEIEEIYQQILSGPAIEGVTLVGGEPFAQAAALAELGRLLKSQGFSIVTFTGYVLEDITAAGREDWQALLEVTDLLLDGPYIEALADLSRPWVGSSNQRYHFLTKRYQDLSEHLNAIPNRLEVRISDEGKVEVNGMAAMGELKEILAAL
jgi:anaerobic ribonucleoside-triphosphate reductase activating protein